MTKTLGINHAVLFISELDRSVAFYQQALGFDVIVRRGDRAAFLRAPGSDNHHDLGLFAMGAQAPKPGEGSVGLYHLAWEIGSIEELAQAALALSEMGALVGMSDHGVSKSLYAKDPDGIEFEVMWRVPREAWGDYEHEAVTKALDLKRELERSGAKAGATAT